MKARSRTDGQTKVTNRSLGNLFQCIVFYHKAAWDVILPNAEFAYNSSVNRTTGSSLFQILYGTQPRTPLDISSLPLSQRTSETELDFSSYMSTLHDDIRKRIAIQTESYAAHANTKRQETNLEVGDHDLIRLRLERFPPGSLGKLHARRAGPFPILKRLGSNAYMVELPKEYNFSPIFNIEDLTLYKGHLPLA